MVARQHYRWDFIGLSTDQKPTPATSEKVVDGSTFYCSNNSKLYVWYKDQWYEKTVSGGGGGTSDFDQLTNRPMYNGVAMTSETNIPEVISYTAGSNITISDGEISATNTTYSNFTGTDGTAAGAAGLVPAPATTDAGKYLKSDGTWAEVQGGGSYTAGDGIDITNAVISATNTGKARILTTADYNYPADNPTGVALWLLEPGVYVLPTDVVGYTQTYHNVPQTAVSGNWLVARGSYGGTPVSGLYLFNGSDKPQYYTTQLSDGSRILSQTYFTDIENNLTSISPSKALSAAQGKVLKDLVDSLVFKNAGAPTTSTVGTVGQLLEDTTNGKLYQCTAVTPGTDPDPDTYTWSEVGAGGSGPTVVQTPGTSTTDVMSQNAVTSMIFADPATMRKIKIGAGASSSEGTSGVEIGHDSTATGNYGVALGEEASAKGNGSVALGRDSRVATGAINGVAIGYNSDATARGEVSLGGSRLDGVGYNNTQYRLLTNVYDGQSAHDAATVGQITPLTDSTAPTTATVGRLGQIFIDTTNADAYMCVVADTVTPAYTWKKITP